jgi:hypothetical protein
VPADALLESERGQRDPLESTGDIRW